MAHRLALRSRVIPGVSQRRACSQANFNASHPDEIGHVWVDLHGHKLMVCDDVIFFLPQLPRRSQFHPLSMRSHTTIRFKAAFLLKASLSLGLDDDHSAGKYKNLTENKNHKDVLWNMNDR